MTVLRADDGWKDGGVALRWTRFLRCDGRWTMLAKPGEIKMLKVARFGIEQKSGIAGKGGECAAKAGSEEPEAVPAVMSLMKYGYKGGECDQSVRVLGAKEGEARMAVGNCSVPGGSE